MEKKMAMNQAKLAKKRTAKNKQKRNKEQTKKKQRTNKKETGGDKKHLTRNKKREKDRTIKGTKVTR